MHDETRNWLKMAEYDLSTAEHMLKSGRNIYVIFMCHLTVEKLLKAVYVEVYQKTPPKTHDLILLTEKASIEFTDDVMDFIGKLNNASVVTRYPQNLSELKASYPKKVAEEYLKETKKVARWLKKDPRLSE